MLIATKVAVLFFVAVWHFRQLYITRALIVPVNVFYDV